MSTKGKTFRKRNPQRKKLMEKLAETGSLTQAAKAAGYSCKQSASNALRNLNARGELIEELGAQGWSPREYIKKHLLPMLGRKRVQYFQNQGIVTDKRIVEDTEAQLVAGDRYLKIIGGYAKNSDDARPDPVLPPTNQVVPPTVPISPETRVAGFVPLGRPRRPRRFWNPGRT